MRNVFVGVFLALVAHDVTRYVLEVLVVQHWRRDAAVARIKRPRHRSYYQTRMVVVRRHPHRLLIDQSRRVPHSERR
jgi:hypothetical protein